MHLTSRFYRSLLRTGAVPPGSRVLVAVSGGSDSVALLHLLQRVAGRLGLMLRAAHLDHALREASGEDARFVAGLCAELGVPLTMERRDVARLARERRGNLEETARDVRREFLLESARAAGCDLVALAHHADDQAETFLMRLMRGSGTEGLAGMRAIDPPIVRPLLTFRHFELLGFLCGENLAWREDESNADLRLTRNRIRHQLLPLLESFNPNVALRLTGLCGQLQLDNDFWADLVAEELSRCGGRRGELFVLDRLRLLACAPALAGRLIRAALLEVRGDLRRVTATHVDDVYALARGGTPQGELHLPGAWVARRYDRLLFAQRAPAPAEPCDLELPGPGVYRCPDGRVVRVTLVEQPLGESSQAVEFDAAAVSFPLRLRHWQPGDRLLPAGMAGTKKAQDLFVDLKLPREERRRALLLCADEVLWVVGVRRCNGRLPRGGGGVLRIVAEACGEGTIDL